MNKPGDLQVWWCPQIPCEAFHYDVPTVEAGVMLLDVMARYDLFQLENNIKPDYANAGGLNIWVEEAEGGAPGWEDWCDEETGEDDPAEWLKQRKDKSC